MKKSLDTLWDRLREIAEEVQSVIGSRPIPVPVPVRSNRRPNR